MSPTTRLEIDAHALAMQRVHLRESLASSLLGQAVAAASHPLAGLGEEGAEMAPVLREFRETPLTLDALLSRALPDLSYVDRLAFRRCLLTSEDPEALGVLLLRALSPLAALKLQPLSQLFTPEQQAQLRAGTPPMHSAVTTRSVTGIIKVTRRCNLRCTYCHDWKTGPDAAMRVDTRLQAMRWLIADSKAREIRVLLHGGEPMLIGERGLLQLLAMQAHLVASGQRVTTHVQSNGTYLSEGILRLLRHFDIAVSVSLDGPPEVHDRTRRDAGGRATAAKVLDGIHRLQSLELLSGVVIVVSRELVMHGAERLVRFLRDQGLGHIALLPMRPAATNGTANLAPVETHSIETRTFLEFLRSVDVARMRLAPWLQVRELDALLRVERGDAAGTCELQGHCVGSYFSIEPDGRVMHCDKYLGDDRYELGHVREPYASVADGARADVVRRRAQARHDRMKACPWYERCKGWCPHEDYVQQQMGTSAPDCCGLAAWFDRTAGTAIGVGDVH